MKFSVLELKRENITKHLHLPNLLNSTTLIHISIIILRSGYCMSGWGAAIWSNWARFNSSLRFILCSSDITNFLWVSPPISHCNENGTRRKKPFFKSTFSLLGQAFVQKGSFSEDVSSLIELKVSSWLIGSVLHGNSLILKNKKNQNVQKCS